MSDNQSLRGFLDATAKTFPEEIIRITEPVGRSLEMTSVVFELDRLGKSPIVIFENVQGSKMPVVTNVAANRKLLAHCLKSDPKDLPTTFRERCQNYIPCELVSKGAWDDVVLEGDQVDLTQLPIPYQFTVDDKVGGGEFGILPPGTGNVTNGGKIYTFAIIESTGK